MSLAFSSFAAPAPMPVPVMPHVMPVPIDPPFVFIRCGLCIIGQQVRVPLESVNVKSTLIDFATEVTVEQVYVNREYRPIETEYVFPLDEKAAVCGFEATLQSTGVTVKGQIKKKAEARAEYNQAVRTGRTAALMEQNKTDVFVCTIGQLQPGERITTRIRYVAEVASEGPKLRFVLPTVVAPRYGGLPSSGPVSSPPPLYAAPLPSFPGPVIHEGIGCDGCKTLPIRGRRYKCQQCPDYDLCDSCYVNRGRLHLNVHTFTVYDSPMSSLPAHAVHTGVRCDGCFANPITGPRFKCSICPDFDLCEACEKSGRMHYNDHPFLKINLPGGVAVAPPGPGPSPAYVPAAAEGYTIRLLLDLHTPSDVVTVTSPSHPIFLDQKGPRHVLVSLQRDSYLDKDIVVLVEQKDPYTPRAVFEYLQDGETYVPSLLKSEVHAMPNLDANKATSRAVSVTFCQQPISALDASDVPCELVFFVDKSGSMQGQPMDAVKQTLGLFLRSLPTNSYFNIISFDSNYKCLNKASVAYSQQSMMQANQFVGALRADGGTELLPALKHVLQMPVVPGHPRQLFVLTDGQVSNTDEVVRTISDFKHAIRVFTFGIGASVSRELVEGMALAGNGSSEFIVKSEDIADKVMRQLERSLQPPLYDVSVNWGLLASQAQRSGFVQVPARVPPIYPGDRYFVYGLALSDDMPENGCEVWVDCLFRDGQKQRIPVSLDNNKVLRGSLIHKLAARRRIKELESSREGKTKAAIDEIVRLSLAHGIMSTHTSFIAVFEQPAALFPQPMVRREVPIAYGPEQFAAPPEQRFFAARSCYSAAMPSAAPSLSMSFGAPAGAMPYAAPAAPTGSWGAPAPPAAYIAPARRSSANSFGGGSRGAAPAAPAAPASDGFGFADYDSSASKLKKKGVWSSQKESEKDSYRSRRDKAEEAEESFDDSADLFTSYGSALSTTNSANNASNTMDLLGFANESKNSQQQSPLFASGSTGDMDRLVSLQQFDGSWNWDAALVTVLCSKVPALQRFSGNQSAADRALKNGVSKFFIGVNPALSSPALGTLVALYLLSQFFASESAKWTLLGNKGRKRLAQMCGISDADVQQKLALLASSVESLF